MPQGRAILPNRRIHALVTLLLLGGCNLYRDTLGTRPETPDQRIVEGQLLLQKSRYEEALEHFDAAIRMDSSKSEAYYGAAKCVLLMEHINMFELVQSFQENDSENLPFIGEPDSVKNKIYQANRGINRYLKRLVALEKAGRSDGKIPVRFIAADYALASALEAVLSLADFNGDGRIDEDDNVLDDVIDFGNPEKLKPDSIMANIQKVKNDTVKIQALNNLLDKSNELLNQSDDAIDLFLDQALSGGGAGEDSGGALGSACRGDSALCDQLGDKASASSDSSVQKVKEFISEAGSSIIIYKIFDRIDNDGDGCIDEELLDGIDNDGDGYVDEDSRGVPDSTGNPRFYAVEDAADNNGDGEIDDDGEARFNSRYAASFGFLRLAALPDGKGQIFWEDSVDTDGKRYIRDRRDTVVVTVDATASPALKDTVVTFDLCRGEVRGFKRSKQK